VIDEEGSKQAVSLWNSDYRNVASILVYPEGRAALSAARRLGRLTGSEYRQALADLEARFADLITVGVDLELALDAGVQAEIFGLGGNDAVHLASALGLEQEAMLVTWDEDLAVAGLSAGLAVAGAAGEE